MLESTLPLLSLLGPYMQRSATDIECPEINIQDVNWYQVRFLNKYVKKTSSTILTSSHTLDLRLLTDNRLLIVDTHREFENEQEANEAADQPNSSASLQNLWAEVTGRVHSDQGPTARADSKSHVVVAEVTQVEANLDKLFQSINKI